MKIIKKFVVCLLIFNAVEILAQSTPLPQPINTGSSEEYNPSVNANGRTMIFEQLYFNEDKVELMITTQKGGAWSRPEALTQANSLLKTIINGGYALNGNGTQVWMHSNRAGGVGSTDIWLVEKNILGAWTLPKNLAKPINSEAAEVDPFLSADGRFLFFTRITDKKNDKGTPCGKIYMAERSGKESWKNPVALPAPVNAGCECAARLLHDNKTMIFASQRAGGMGGFDLYRTQWQEDNSWSTPEPLTFLNTAEDDRYVSVPAGGGIIYHTGQAKTGGRDIFRTKIPDNLAQDKVLLLSGIVKNSNNLVVPPRISVTAIGSGKSYQYYGAPDGTYTITLPVGDAYDVAAQAQDGGYSFQSTLYDLKNSTKYEEKIYDAKLFALKPAQTFSLNNVSFLNNSDTIAPSSIPELNRLVLMLKAATTMKVELGVYCDKEEISETASLEFVRAIVDTVSKTTDSLGVEQVELKTTYSSNNTNAQAKAISQWLVRKGMPAERVAVKGYGKATVPKKVELKVITP